MSHSKKGLHMNWDRTEGNSTPVAGQITMQWDTATDSRFAKSRYAA
ncbi:MAG: hypothetical protein ABIR55_08740 [Burkholderiaceae bacterium]